MDYELLVRIDDCLHRRRKISAIKLLRGVVTLGLKEAKFIIDARCSELGLTIPCSEGLDQIDSRGTHMTVRPMTEAEKKQWPDGEIAFTIHYGEGDIKAHALTTVEAAQEFAKTIEKVCRDGKRIERE